MQPSYLKKSMGVIAIAVFSLSSLISVYGGLLSTNNTTVSFTITAGALSI